VLFRSIENRDSHGPSRYFKWHCQTNSTTGIIRATHEIYSNKNCSSPITTGQLVKDYDSNVCITNTTAQLFCTQNSVPYEEHMNDSAGRVYGSFSTKEQCEAHEPVQAYNWFSGCDGNGTFSSACGVTYFMRPDCTGFISFEEYPENCVGRSDAYGDDDEFPSYDNQYESYHYNCFAHSCSLQTGESSAAIRFNKKTWVSSSVAPQASVCDFYPVQRFNFLSIKSVLQSPSQSCLNLVMTLLNNKGNGIGNAEKTFVTLTLIAHYWMGQPGTMPIVLFKRRSNLASDDAFLTLLTPLPGHGATSVKISLQLDFARVGVTIPPGGYFAMVEVSQWGEAGEERLDCVKLEH